MSRLVLKSVVMVIFIFPTIISTFLLIKYYPNTGLGRIISIPITFIINISIILLGVVVTDKLRKTQVWMVWALIVVITILFTLLLYPQDYGPHVFYKIWNEL